MNTCRPSRPIPATVIAALLAATPASAAPWTWTGFAGNNSWNNGGNWSPVSPPASVETTDLIFGGTLRLTPDLTLPWLVNSVTFNNSAGAFNLFSTAGNTLFIGAGGITNNDTDAQTISHALTLFAPQTWSSAAGRLAIVGPVQNNGHLLTINAGAAFVNIAGNSVLSGSGGLTKTGLHELQFNDGTTPNTYSGTTTVSAGSVLLNRVGGVAIPGNLVIGDGVGPGVDTVSNFRGNQIATSATVSVFSTGAWGLNILDSETITNLNIVSTGVPNGAAVTLGGGTLTTLGTVTMTGGLITTVSTGTLALGGNLTTNASDLTATISSKLDLGGGTRTFTVADGAVANDLDVGGAVSNGGIIKNGPGTLLLRGNSTFAGGTTLNAGTLAVGHNSALGTGTLTLNGGSLQADGANRRLGNAIVLGASAVVDGAFDLTFDSPMSGSGGLTKNGPGALNLDAVAANTYSGTTTVNAGELSLGGIAQIVAIPGSLVIGDGVGTDLDLVISIASDSIADGATVSILATGHWRLYADVSGASETITNLNIVSTGVPNGGAVAIGQGTVTTLGTVTMTGGLITTVSAGTLALGGNLTTNASGLTATISSKLDLSGGTRTFTVADGAAANDLDVTGVVSNGGIIKAGPGALRLAVANTFAGSTTLNAGTILIGHDSALGTGPVIAGFGTLQADGAARTIPNAVSGSFALEGAFDLALTSPSHGAITKAGTGTLVFAQAGAVVDSLALNAGTVRLDAAVTFANGLTNSATLLLGTPTLTVNGTGLDNQSSLHLAGHTLAGSGPVVNHSLLSGTGTIAGSGGFTNNAQLTVSGGNFTLSKAGANVNAGNVSVASGLQLRLTGGALANAGTVDLAGGVITGTAALNNNPGGTVSGRGTISAPFANSGGTLRAVGGTMNVPNAFASSGIIRLDDAAALAGGAITNTGRIQGDGSIGNALTNASGGSIRADTGRTLFFTGAFAPNAGEMNLQGGTLHFTGAITNSAAGFIAGRGALYTASLTNSGQMAFSGGYADLHGDVSLTAGARVVTSGAGSVTTFWDDVVHNGTEIFTGVSCSTVFFGGQSGAGSFTGSGTIYFIGDLRPGSSPGAINYAPQVIFAPSNSLTVEIGGLTAGTQHDKLTFTHATAPQVTWGGTLAVTLINGFTPAAGQSFDVFDFDPARDAGTFAVLNLPPLTAGLTWDTTQLYNTGVITVVTEGLTFAQWATASGIPGALPAGDHDSDGYDNATEFALGLFPPQPGSAEPSGGFFTYVEGERLRLLFTRPLDRTGVTLKVQASDDLVLWDDLAISVNSAVFTGPGFVSENRAHPLTEPGLVEVRDILNTSTTPRRQMRVRITLAP